MGFTRPHVKSARLINGTLGGSVSARVANGGLARPARSLGVSRGPGRPISRMLTIDRKPDVNDLFSISGLASFLPPLERSSL